MNRRHFLKAMLGTGVAGGGMLLGSRAGLRVNSARAAPSLPALIVVFQRGGCDGLNTVVPYGDPDYAGLRPTIGIGRPLASDPTSALDLDGFFGLHPALEPLMEIHAAGELAVMPTVQYPSPSRSHFDSQHFIESGVRDKDATSGWLNRLLAEVPAAESLRAAHFGGALSQSLRGDIPVASFNSLGSFSLGLSDADEQNLVDHVLPVYLQDPVNPTDYRWLIRDFGRMLFGNLNTVLGLDYGNYQPENGAAYPNSSYGRRLRDIAYLLKEPSVELEVATVDIGGWDTHSSQGGGESDGRQARRFSEFSQGLNALYRDLGPLLNNVVVLTMTEFGRTAKENGSRGTDHGIASSWFAFGGGIRGGLHMGSDGWPGLSGNDLVNGRYLNFTVNHRDIMGDILVNHMGVSNLGNLLPGHAHNPLGLFA